MFFPCENTDTNFFIKKGMVFWIGSDKTHHETDSGHRGPVRRTISAGTILIALDDHYNDQLVSKHYFTKEIVFNLSHRRGKVLTPFGVGWVLYNGLNVTVASTGEEDGNSEEAQS